MAGLGEGVPGKVEPTIAGEELIGKGVMAKKVDQAIELSRILGPDVGSLTDQVLRVAYTPYPAIDVLRAETGIDDDRAHNLAGRL